MAGSAGGDEEVGKWEAWTPQPMMCGTQLNRGEVLQGTIWDQKMREKFTELADQLKV